MFSRLPGGVIAGVVVVSLGSACSKPDVDAHFKRANNYAEQSRLSEAIIEYRLALQAAPSRGDIRLNLADAYFRNHDAANALKESVRAADLLPGDATAQLKAGNMLLLAHSFEDAKARANKILALDRNSADGQILLGNALAGLKDMDGAVAEYQEAIALNPSADNAYLSIGAIQLARGNRTEAETSFRKATEVAPKSVPALMALANFLWASGRVAEGEQTLKDALALEPANLKANRALGIFYVASNRAAEAEPYFKVIAKTANTTAATLSLSDYYVLTKRLGDAKTVLNELAKQKDAYAAATTRLAAVDVVERNRSVALTKLGDVLGKYPKDAPAHLLRARVLMMDGKRDEAMADANAIVTDDPNSSQVSDAFLIIGNIQASLDRTDDAIKAYEEVLRRTPKPIAANLALGSLYLKRGSLDKAATYDEQARAIDPNNPQARTLQVRILLAQRNMARAKEELASLRKAFPSSPSVLALVGAQQLAERQFDAARASYMKAAELAPNDLEALAGLVTVDLLRGHAKDAVGRIEESLKRTAPTANFLMLAAQTYEAAGEPTKAEELLKRAIEVEPARLQAYSLLGRFYYKQNRLDDARSQFQSIAERNPKSTSAITMLGTLLQVQQRLPEAEQQYQRVLAFDSRAPVASNNLAWLYVTNNRNLDQALQLAQGALQQLPDEPHIMDTVGWIYYRKNMASAAIPHLESSVRSDPNDPTSHYHLGMAYRQVGQFAKATTELQRALAFKTEFDGAAEARQALAGMGS
jgi:tetratricopeptide (TPR) repeat protein